MKNFTPLIFILISINIFAQNSTIVPGFKEFNDGWKKYDSRDLHGAIEDFNKAIEINPNYYDAFEQRGFTKMNLGDYLGAINDLSKAIEIEPENPRAYTYRALNKEYLKDF